jgi:hypothetical protein
MAMNDVIVVLAHGGWADGSSWARVITGLAAHGIKAVAAPLPLTELADDVAALDRSIERVPGPVVDIIREAVQSRGQVKPLAKAAGDQLQPRRHRIASRGGFDGAYKIRHGYDRRLQGVLSRSRE